MQKIYKAGDMLHPGGYKDKTSFLAKGASKLLLTTNPTEAVYDLIFPFPSTLSEFSWYLENYRWRTVIEMSNACKSDPTRKHPWQSPMLLHYEWSKI